MRQALLLFAMLETGRGNNTVPPANDLKPIDNLNDCVQARFEQPPDALLGMSRAFNPQSMREHYVPLFNVTRDFLPENKPEERALADLEAGQLQVGAYLFGRAILDAPAGQFNYRALKGPAAVTMGTPRPALYPTAVNPKPSPDALPDWNAIYPLAQRAMKSFRDGGSGFETSLGAASPSWRIAARPVLAGSEKCLACHGGPARVSVGQPLGGVLYAFRRTEK
jgi:hypothetical protein